ncbi:U2 snRNP complex subunit msl1 [Orbilia brochopaga]|uniref:U2 snRNP complex subunit msl1 n=1 Tax=Orbilia brochopaga TaxID=3140254 RepID=A0AAV9U6B7_9PEZI
MAATLPRPTGIPPPRPPPPSFAAPAGGASSGGSSVPPNQTLYISNLNDKIHKPDLKIALYTLFSTYGVVLDVVALKTMKMRGQAHVAFRDLAGASSAMRACQGMSFFGKEMKIQYAKSKSDTIAKLDGTYRMPSLRTAEDAAAASAAFAPLPGQDSKKAEEVSSGPGLAAAAPATGGAAGEAHGTKRQRDESESEQSDVEMEVEDDDED